MTEIVDKSTDWFPAKKYGWGWGLPSRWPGVVTLVVFVALAVANALSFPPTSRPVIFVGGTLVLSGAMLVVCCLKGEPPKWRWDGAD